MDPKDLGLGLSRLLRYSYGGFLLIVVVSVFYRDRFEPIRVAMGWELAALTAVVVGAGIYAVHRSVVVPIHHAFLCLLWWLVDSVIGRDRSSSANPTRWLGSLGVTWCWRISAYTLLRSSDVFKAEKADWDIAHAESGLLLMSAEAVLLAAVLAFSQQSCSPVGCEPLAWSFWVLLVFSFTGWVQHAIECSRFKDASTAEDVNKLLKSVGMLSEVRSASTGTVRCWFLVAGLALILLAGLSGSRAREISNCLRIFVWMSAAVTGVIGGLFLFGALRLKAA